MFEFEFVLFFFRIQELPDPARHRRSHPTKHSNTPNRWRNKSALKIGQVSTPVDRRSGRNISATPRHPRRFWPSPRFLSRATIKRANRIDPQSRWNTSGPGERSRLGKIAPAKTASNRSPRGKGGGAASLETVWPLIFAIVRRVHESANPLPRHLWPVNTFRRLRSGRPGVRQTSPFQASQK